MRLNLLAGRAGRSRGADQRAAFARPSMPSLHLCSLFATTVSLAAMLLASPSLALAQSAAIGDSGRDARDMALAAVPMDQLTEATQSKLWPVLSQPSVFRSVPPQTIDCDPQLHVFLVRHPEVIVNIWQVMGITKVDVRRTGDYTFSATDGAGTVTDVELVYGTPELHIYYAEGYYEGVMFRNRIEGACVLVVRSEYSQHAGRPVVTDRMDFFVRFKHAGADLLAKTLHPLVGKSADHNFVESTKFISQVSQATEMNGPGMTRLAEKLANIDPGVRSDFIKFTEAIYQRAVLRNGGDQTPMPSSLPRSLTTTARPILERLAQAETAAIESDSTAAAESTGDSDSAASAHAAAQISAESAKPPYSSPVTKPTFRR